MTPHRKVQIPTQSCAGYGSLVLTHAMRTRHSSRSGRRSAPLVLPCVPGRRTWHFSTAETLGTLQSLDSTTGFFGQHLTPAETTGHLSMSSFCCCSFKFVARFLYTCRYPQALGHAFSSWANVARCTYDANLQHAHVSSASRCVGQPQTSSMLESAALYHGSSHLPYKSNALGCGNLHALGPAPTSKPGGTTMLVGVPRKAHELRELLGIAGLPEPGSLCHVR